MVAEATVLNVTPRGSKINVSADEVGRAIGRATRWAGGRAPAGGMRYDSVGNPVMPSRHALDAYNRYCDQLALREAAQDGGGRIRADSSIRGHFAEYVSSLPKERRDALGAGLSGGAGGFPRDFEYIRTGLWTEKRMPLNALRLFPRDTAVPLGARTHTSRRLVGSGEAEIFRGGSVEVRARTSLKEETFGVVYIVSAVQTQFFEQLTTDYAGIRQYQNDMRMANRLVDERVNDIFFNGDEASDVFGILNYPHLATQLFPLAASDATDPIGFIRALNNAQYTPMIRTGGTFSPTKSVTSPRIRAWLYSRKHDLAGAPDTTMARFFLDNQDPSGGIQSIEAAQEMQGIGPNGEDGFLMYRPDLESMGLVDIQTVTTLPVFQSSALEQITVVYAAVGGVTMGDVGNHILLLIPTDGIG